MLASLALGGSLVGAAAHAQDVSIASPTTGNSQLVFFVNEDDTNNTYALVLNYNVTGTGGLFTYAAGTGSTSAVTTYSGDTSFSVNIGADSALTSFISGVSGGYGAPGTTLQWGVMGGERASTATPGLAGGSIAETTSSGGASSVIGITRNSISGGTGMLSSTGGFTADINTLATEPAETSFNATYPNGVIGSSLSATGNNVTLYGTDIDAGNNALSTALPFYALTVGSSTVTGAGSDEVPFLLGTFSITGTGSAMELVFTAANSVPLPAAVWLLGSGLLGLVGVGRRRAATLASA
ncbi:MAG TPA: VPLPA-CTERM sorting domain-containing protein [Steroidobacteraceae bacterium]|nr:VPLPA-CTERM sorting domain-containing protein [Steroidobacteraceae bacterium]